MKNIDSLAIRMVARPTGQTMAYDTQVAIEE